MPVARVPAVPMNLHPSDSTVSGNADRTFEVYGAIGSFVEVNRPEVASTTSSEAAVALYRLDETIELIVQLPSERLTITRSKPLG